jgi:hypothetical protein
LTSALDKNPELSNKKLFLILEPPSGNMNSASSSISLIKSNSVDYEKVFAGYNKNLKLTSEEKQSAVFVMECIELLFLAYFEDKKDSALSKSTCSILDFIRTNEKRIARIIR